MDFHAPCRSRSNCSHATATTLNVFTPCPTSWYANWPRPRPLSPPPPTHARCIQMRSQAWTALGQWTHAMPGHFHLTPTPCSRPLRPPLDYCPAFCLLFFEGFRKRVNWLKKKNKKEKGKPTKNHNHCILAGAAAVIIQWKSWRYNCRTQLLFSHSCGLRINPRSLAFPWLFHYIFCSAADLSWWPRFRTKVLHTFSCDTPYGRATVCVCLCRHVLSKFDQVAFPGTSTFALFRHSGCHLS